MEAGRGYSPAEQRGKLPIGELPVDAIYSPVKRVNFEVEAARVGQMTNYDRLITEIWTDGTMRPQDALSQAATILVQHLQLIAGVSARRGDAGRRQPRARASPASWATSRSRTWS